ncbi:unnamed protein product [Linum trigynum]|uniref:LYK4/5 third LysM domain-containing protein n=1 Tax=Linum trigynum TaxID=586398 RepID=A0AAV2E3N3_9ROSI
MVSMASSRFDSDTGWTLQANGLTEQSATIFPFTTLLIQMQNPPSSIETVSPPPPPASPPPPPVEPSTPGSSSSKTWVHVVAGVVGGIVATLTVVGTVVYCLWFRRRKAKLEPAGTTSESFEAVEKKSMKNKGEEEEPEGFFLEKLSIIAHSIQVYTFEEVMVVTDNFSPKCLIKGSVYRGKINGDLAAIKKMDGDVTKEMIIQQRWKDIDLDSKNPDFCGCSFGTRLFTQFHKSSTGSQDIKAGMCFSLVILGAG